ncbi:LysR family transcriptional regulator [Paralcaligenes sp. KSB-10]|uniref:LysR family transcriptional regulator n=1 Tax=Paralcaligenes sp. KSB-10 TaxID=2901142 RepID=UPI001E2EB8A7|nr:LysR family transcriptional regulator [Paralcaligenes sp. KSB-10]UHL62942.1 LysR family transcriptional regulator [Paralcaligenes sp. KSB-10]
MSSIRTLRTFLAVVRYGTFAAAGAEIGLTAAAVGLQIKTLEQALNCELFVRTGRSAVLSPQGQAKVAEVQAIVRAYDALASSHDDGELSGPVAVGALVSALMGAFSDALRAIKKKHPGLNVKLYAGLSSEFADKVQRGELDAAVVTQSPVLLSSELIWTPLYTEPMVLIVPSQSPEAVDSSLTPDEVLATLPFLRFDRRTWTGQLVQKVLESFAAKPNEEMELNSIETIIELVRQGFGGSIVPKLANVDWANDRRLRVIELPDVQICRRVGLLERQSHFRLSFTSEIKSYFSAAAQIRPGK